MGAVECPKQYLPLQAYSKALGLGLAAPLGKASFSISPDSSCASLCLSGAEREDWAFRLHKLPQGHWAAVARAPPAQIVDAHGVSGLRGCWRSIDWVWKAKWALQQYRPCV